MKKYIVLLLSSVIALQLSAQKKTVRIQITGAITTDTLWEDMTIQVWDELLTQRTAVETKYRSFTSPVLNGSFAFEVNDASRLTYISIGQKNKTSREFLPLMNLFVAEPGDSLHIELNNVKPAYRGIPEVKEMWLAGYIPGAVKVSGRGAAKVELLYALEQHETAWQEQMQKQARAARLEDAIDSVYASMQILENKLQGKLSILRQYRGQISNNIYQLMLAELVGNNYTDRYEMLRMNTGMIRRNLPALLPQAKAKGLEVYTALQKHTRLDIQPAILSNSKDYLSMIVAEAKMLSLLQGDSTSPYHLIRNRYKGIIREKAICAYFMENGRLISDLKPQLDDALTYVKTPFCKNILEETVRTSTPGVPAFDFVLENTTGKTVSLASLKGKIVFIDFWYTGCGACSGFYHASLSKVEKEFEHNPNIVFVTISVDKNKNTWQRSVQAGQYTTPDAANVINLYTGGLGPDHDMIRWYRIKGYPHQLLIDKEGKLIKASDLQVRPEQLKGILQSALKTHS